MLRTLMLPELSGFTRFRMVVAAGFSAFFLFVAVTIGGLAVFELARSLYQFVAAAFRGGELVTGFMGGAEGGGEELIAGIIQGINTAIIAVAAFELGMGIGKEYGTPENEGNLYRVVRRTITRFVGLVCIALVLEALIMVIKYSQLELAGNLGYPVAILVGASTLLLALGGFLALTRRDSIPARRPVASGEAEAPVRPLRQGDDGARSTAASG
ncbi:MAG TPA: hypothetical protein VKA55_00540 [Gammaproteobacteria bacterium]|nr:hypothetical protein [Gammaproteobacteria bacterium]